VPLDLQWDLADGSLSKAIEMSPPNIVFIASPNNPTGNVMARRRLLNVIDAARDSLVVIDEAYVDYAGGDHLDLYRAHDNVALLRTLSKVGFAGLRVGWLVGRPELVREVDKVRSPYNVSSASQSLARTVLTELGDEISRITREVIAERERLIPLLSEIPGVSVSPSQANFVWVHTERPAAEVFENLAKRGVLVRSFHARGGRLAHQLRVTIGTRAENDAFLDALREVGSG
jgi:histidinol-phosphate aminotransferase